MSSNPCQRPQQRPQPLISIAVGKGITSTPVSYVHGLLPNQDWIQSMVADITIWIPAMS